MLQARKEGPLNMKEILRNEELQEAHGKFWEEINSIKSAEEIKENRKKTTPELKK